jgi:hypothetical protein
MSEDRRMVKIAEMLEFTSKAGNRYFRGYVGDVEYVMFYGGEKELKSRPGETVPMWRLLVQERDPSRRPQQREQPPAAEAARGHQSNQPLDDVARGWSQAERDRHTNELAAKFQPNEEIPF